MTATLQLFDLSLNTDHKPLLDYVRRHKKGHEPYTIDEHFPGITKAILDGCGLLERKRLRPTSITYRNFRIQVWADGFDADPTPPTRVIPKNMTTDTNSISFA